MASLDDLIKMDEQQRMVPADRAGLAQEVARLLAGQRSVPTLRRAGIGLVALGECDRAIAILTEARELADAGPPGGSAGLRARIAIRINLGDAHRYAGQFAPAQRWCEQALLLAREQQPELVDFALQHLGKCHLDQGAFPAAAECLREALALRRRKGDVDLIRSTEAALALLPSST